MASEAIHLPGADVAFDPNWLEAADAWALFGALTGLPWERHRITVYGRTIDAPRLSCWIGEVAYRYSGALFEPHPWPEALLPVRERLARELRGDFNSVLANLYRDGDDRLGFHRDSEPQLGPEPLIASVSLGATRRFRFRARDGAGSLGIDLTHGSLLVMSGATQRNWLHRRPAHQPHLPARGAAVISLRRRAVPAP